MPTFLFSDIEGSTRLWEQCPQDMGTALAYHDKVFRQTIEEKQGRIFKTGGDAFYVVFEDATSALEAAIKMQQQIWANDVPLRLHVRMALYTGDAEERDGDFFGVTLNRVARLLGASHGGQILLQAATKNAIAGLSHVEYRDLGRHRLRDIEGTEHIFQVLAPHLPVIFPPIQSLSPRPTNLTAPLTSFVGREKEIETISTLLRRPQIRLLTLIGTGGIGKTRLSLQVGEAVLDEYEDGVFFIGLETVTQPSRILEAIAHQLDIPESPDQSIEQTLKDHLRTRKMLLLLDNFEQVVEGAGSISELLKAALGLKILVTSREELSVYGEHIYPVLPLTIPDENMSLDEICTYPAVALFVERALAMQPAFTLSQDNGQKVVNICKRLDGLPLAIELATAQMKHLSLEEIDTQLTDRLNLLESKYRDLPPRQRTMRGAIDWSYSLLSPAQQKAFARLGIFRDHFTEEAGNAVTNGADLLSLVDKNLVYHSVEFWLLGVVRDFALEKLTEQGDRQDASRRHAGYYRDLLETAEPYLTGAEQDQWFIQLAAAYENVRAALDWSLSNGEHETAARIASVLWRYWNAHSYLSEAQNYLHQILAIIQTEDVPTSVQTKVMFGAARLAILRQQYDTAETLMKSALEIAQKNNDQHWEAFILLSFGESKSLQEDYLSAERYLLQSWVMFRSLGDNTGLARSLENLGNIAHMLGNYENAIFFLEQSLALEKQRDSLEGQALALNNLAEVWRVKGDYEQAIAYYTQSLALFRRLKWTAAIATVMLNLGHTYRRQSDFTKAGNLFGESLELLKELEEQSLLAECLAGLSMVLVATNQQEGAAILFGAVRRLLATLEADLDPVDRDEFQAVQETTRQALGESAWGQMWNKGQAMSLEQSLQYARDIYRVMAS